MAWTLKIVPKGLLLSKFIKNSLILNQDSLYNNASNPILLDKFQTYNSTTNTVDLILMLSLFNNDPLNESPEPTITGISQISISNDPQFKEVFYLAPTIFSAAYSTQTDYLYDLSANNVSTSSLPSTLAITFTESSGSGYIKIKSWPLSGSSGLKKVFLSLSVILSNGDIAVYPFDYDVFDEIIVAASLLSPPSTPEILSKTNSIYTSLPIYYQSDVANNSSITQTSDSGIASYFWDTLFLAGNTDIVRNNYSPKGLQLFIDASPTTLNTEKFPIVFNSTTSTGVGSTAVYNSYISATSFQLTSTKNIYFFEAYVNYKSYTYNWTSTPNLFWEFNFISQNNKSSNTKFLRQQLITDEKFKTCTIITSIDDSTWSTDSTYVPAANYTQEIITDSNLVAQITSPGIFLSTIEIIDSVNQIFQSKLIFKPRDLDQNIVISEKVFRSNSLALSTNIFAECRFYTQNATANVILESSQYGLAYGTLSGSSTPSDKILTNESLFVKNSVEDIYSSEALNTWFQISNSPSSGVLNEISGSVNFFSNTGNNSTNNVSGVEIQNSIPTFSDENTFTTTFFVNSSNVNSGNRNTKIKTAYSFDTGLLYSNYIFNDLLKTSSGVYLPQSSSSYVFSASLDWSGSNAFNLSVFDLGSAQTCSISTTLTNNLFFYSKANSYNLTTPPVIIQSRQGLSSSNTFLAWITTNGLATTYITDKTLSVKNIGLTSISVTSASGINTVAPGSPYVVNDISTSSSLPTSFIINSHTSTVNTSVNFLYDFGQLGEIYSLGLSIQITTPPDCPALLPSIQYSIEVSADFITWTYLNNSYVSSEDFNPNTGSLSLVFLTPANSGDTNDYRYARLRIYYNVSATFDPRNVYRYFNLTGVQQDIANSLLATGKFIFGLTDQGAKDSSLGNLYNQPTYLRKFVSNTSTTAAIVFDFADYVAADQGPVYINFLTNQSENRLYTIESNFSFNTNYTSVLTLSRADANDAFRLKASMSLSGSNISTVNIDTNLILTTPTPSGMVTGYYPFISLMGDANITVSSASVIKGTFNQGLSMDNEKTYLSLSSGENTDYTSSFGKNILAQNTFDLSTSSFPQVNQFFIGNTIKSFSYSNVTFTVVAAATNPVGPYGLTYIDGVYVSPCDYVLLAGQQDQSTNGVYQVQLQQWVKQSISGSPEPTVLSTQGNIFGDTLWMRDVITSEWIPNIIATPFVLNDNTLLSTGISTFYKYPRYIRIASNTLSSAEVNSLDQVKIKLVQSLSGLIDETSSSTQWNSILQNGVFNTLTNKSNSNNTVFLNFGLSTTMIAGITTSVLPSVYYLITSYAGSYVPTVTNGSSFNLPEYGKSYRCFYNSELIYQLFSTYKSINISLVDNSLLNVATYGQSVANAKTPQSGFSTNVKIDTSAPVVGILSKSSDQVKSVTLGLTSAIDSESGLLLARVVQYTPTQQIVCGSWFGFSSNSFTGISTIVAYPSYVTNKSGITTGQPLSGFYKYNLQVSDRAGNVTSTNQVESFYYEIAVIDTQGPTASIQFVQPNNVTPISINTSTIVTAQIQASDALTGIKAYRYKVLPSGEFSNWIDYSEYADILLPDGIGDGTLSVQFQFKDYGNNVLYDSSTITGEEYYVYTWNIISKLITNVLFTVTEYTTFNGRDVLIVGGSKQGVAVAYLWDSNVLIEVQNSSFSPSKAITAFCRVGSKVLIGTDNGRIFLYQNGIFSGPYDTLSWGSSGLPISNFALHQYSNDTVEYVYATTLNIPRIFRTPSSNLTNLNWEIVQTPPVYIKKINVDNVGLWSGTSISYAISSTYQQAVVSAVQSFGISSVIISNKGSNYTTTPNITVTGTLSGAGFTPVLQGRINNLNLFSGGIGYTAGATISISAPASGSSSIQATGYAVTNSGGQIVSIGLSSAGYGYTSVPSITITGNSGLGSQAAATSSLIFDSLYSVQVTSPGVSTNTSITLSVTGNNGVNAVIYPTFQYSVSALSITTSGFGYTSVPAISINGITSLATATISGGSVQTATMTAAGIGYTFSGTVAPTVLVVGGGVTNWAGTFTTSAISFSTGAVTNYSGTILQSVTLTDAPHGISTTPSIVFTDSIYNPELSYVLSDDLTLYTNSGSIYDIKSFDDKLFFTTSSRGIIELGLSSGNFTATQHPITIETNIYEKLTPQHLALYDNGITTSLYFNVAEESIIGRFQKNLDDIVLEKYHNEMLLFRPYNFDILSDWQLVKNYSTNGIGTISYGDSQHNSLIISSHNGQVFYESTKNNIWFNRCTTNSNYLLSVKIKPITGTQCLEISTFTSDLKISFTTLESSLQISIGYKNYVSFEIDTQDTYSISILKSGSGITIYNGKTSVYTNTSFFTSVNSYPKIRFGYIFEPQVLFINNQNQNLFGLPAVINDSSFTWYELKFTFDTGDFISSDSHYSINFPYSLPNASSVRVLKHLNGSLFAVTKALTDTRTTTAVDDVETRVYRLTQDTWVDVTGNFELTSTGVTTSYVISSPNDINVLGDSYFITGLTKPIAYRSQSAPSILLGLSTSRIFEDQDVNLVIIYPYNPYPSGSFITLSANTSYITIPPPVYFGSNTIAKVVSIGIGSTSVNTAFTISATDGITTSQTSGTIIPIGIASIGLSTNYFVGFSSTLISATVTFNSRPKTNRIFGLTSNNLSVLGVNGTGISTLIAGSISTNINMVVGTAVTTSSSINVSAIYRTSIATAAITVAPFILSLGLNTSSFFGNQLYGSVIATATVQAPPRANLNLVLTSGLSTILAAPSVAVIPVGLVTTSYAFTIGSAVTSNINVNVGASVTGSIATSVVSAAPIVVSTVTADIIRPILGLQTSAVTFTLNTTPISNLLIYCVVQNPAGVSMVFPSATSVLGGTVSTSFAISTTVQHALGLGVTIQGAPLGYNTSPLIGLTLLSDIWRITNLQVSPNSIVGAGGDALGIAQSFIVTATVNLGVATTVSLTSNSGYVHLNSITFSGGTTASSFATGFSTSLITGIAITALGPHGLTSSVYGLTLNPFLINSFTFNPIWNGGFSSNYLVTGIGASASAIVTLNAYPLSGSQTIQFSSINTNLFIYDQSYSYSLLGYGTVSVGAVSTSIIFGANTVPGLISTSITAKTGTVSGIATTTANLSAAPLYTLIFNPILSNQNSTYSINLASPLPIGVGFAVTFDNGQNQSYTLPPSISGFSTGIKYNTIYRDTTVIATASMIGVFQTYFVVGYANSGGAYAMGYNTRGELSSNYPSNQGSASKIYMGLPKIVKVVSGNNHVMALDYLGNVYAIGDNVYNQLGYDSAIGLSTSVFKRIQFNYQAKDIYAVNNTSYVLLSNGELYSFGSNISGAMGISTSVFSGISTFTPTLVSKNVRLCSVFNNRGVIVTYANPTGLHSIYEFGSDQAVTGLTTKSISQITALGASRTISGLIIYAIDAGPNHTVSAASWLDTGYGISSSGLLAWGSNAYYQIGTASTTGSISVPNLLHKYNSLGTAVPIEYTRMIVANYNSSIAIGSANSMYVVGLANSNNAGTGNTTLNAAIAIYPAIGFATASEVYKINKSSNQTVYVTGIGSVYVSGGVVDQTLAAYGDFGAVTGGGVFVDNASPSMIMSYNLCSPPQLNYFNTVFSIPSNSVIKVTSSPLEKVNDSGFFAAVLYNNGVNIVYTDSRYTISQNFGFYGLSTSIDATTNSPFAINSGTYPTYYQYIFGLSDTSSGVTTSVSIQQYIGVSSSMYGTQSLTDNGSFSFYRSSNPTKIESGWLRNYIGLYYTSGITYNWMNSQYNCVVGYRNGTVELYGNPEHYGIGTIQYGSSLSIAFINSWSVTGEVSAMKSLRSLSSGKTYLIIATKSGNVYSYNADGGGDSTNQYTQSTSLPPLIASSTIPSIYGYITMITQYEGGSFIAATSNNYILLMSATGLTIFASTQNSDGNITSLLVTNSVSVVLVSGVPLIIYITTSTNKYYSYYISPIASYELGLSYLNNSGDQQLMTYSGISTGLGVTNIFASTTSDAFTIILDSSRPSG